MTVIDRWIAVAESGDTAAIADLLAEDAVFSSPAVFTPQRGKATTLAYLSAAATLLGGPDFRYVEQWRGERSAVLEFETEVDGIHVNGVDIISWNDDGEIDAFKVMLRPFKALQTVIPKMAELLQQAGRP
ncbi:nuclear transport factor 2 family protein [Mycobacterium sp. MYCO198283]|uniref:nuclear transport factor 2 family protein n=1 Tax=Mycobacterium sp. MYCO198283 TaxID=2883505 RepID=UPI001E365B16|nr:nuclear transport factor 2 family protein [Mycobacterium sp. MYCO198283]MCG5432936.1 nuclear transport factor 2 family protein [Mycobacterium sp. MYCO198283]